jgi:hypothetical protein
MKSFSQKESFETDVMIDKIQKVKNKKKKKNALYQNIEVLDTILETDETPDRFRTFTEVEGMKTKQNEPIREGLDLGLKLTNNGIADFSDPKLWDGTDTVEDFGSGDAEFMDPRQLFIDAINDFFIELGIIQSSIATQICTSFSGNSYKTNDGTLENDKTVINNTIGMFSSIAVAYYMLYNIYYITMFEDEHQNKPNVFEYTNENTMWVYDLVHPLKLIIKYPFYFLVKITFYGMYFIPQIMKQSGHFYNASFILFYFLLILFIYYSIHFLQQFFVALVSIDLFYLMSVFESHTESSQKVFIMVSFIIYLTIIVNFIFFDSPCYVNFQLAAGPLAAMVFYQVILFLYLMLVLFTSPILCGFAMFFYLLYLLFFSILYNVGSSDYFRIINEIDLFLYKKIDIVKLEEDPSIFSYAEYWSKKIYNLFKQNLFSLTFLYTVLYTSSYYNGSLQNGNLNGNLQILNIFLMCFVLFRLFMKYINVFVHPSDDESVSNYFDDFDALKQIDPLSSTTSSNTNTNP